MYSLGIVLALIGVIFLWLGRLFLAIDVCLLRIASKMSKDHELLLSKAKKEYNLSTDELNCKDES